MAEAIARLGGITMYNVISLTIDQLAFSNNPEIKKGLKSGLKVFFVPMFYKNLFGVEIT